MHVDHHDLDHEFPKLHNVMEDLRTQNDRFKTIFEEYNRLTDEI